MQTGSPIANSQPYAANQPGSERPLRIVIADSSEDYRVVLRELLQMLFDVEIVGLGSNGFEALELTAEHAPDLVIMDVNMPVLNGIVAASLISTHFPTTTILMMSAEDSPEIRERCLRSGAQSFSPKSALPHQMAALQKRFV